MYQDVVARRPRRAEVRAAIRQAAAAPASARRCAGKQGLGLERHIRVQVWVTQHKRKPMRSLARLLDGSVIYTALPIP